MVGKLTIRYRWYGDRVTTLFGIEGEVRRVDPRDGWLQVWYDYGDGSGYTWTHPFDVFETRRGAETPHPDGYGLFGPLGMRGVQGRRMTDR